MATWLRGFETPERADVQALEPWLAANPFPDGTIFHRTMTAPEVADAVDAYLPFGDDCSRSL